MFTSAHLSVHGQHQRRRPGQMGEEGPACLAEKTETLPSDSGAHDGD